MRLLLFTVATFTAVSAAAQPAGFFDPIDLGLNYVRSSEDVDGPGTCYDVNVGTIYRCPDDASCTPAARGIGSTTALAVHPNAGKTTALANRVSAERRWSP